MRYGYIRVSSDKQTVENQRFEIEQFCLREGVQVDGWIEETVSGTKPYSKRQLGKLLRHVYIRKSLQSGRSKRSIARSLHCSRNTLSRYILQNDL